MNQKIGMITFHRANNLGAALQAYALYTYLNENICPTEIIDYYPNNAIPARNTLLRRAMRMVKKTVGGKEQKDRYQRFEKFDAFINECRISEKVYYGDKAIEADPPKYDLIISGSDQILNTTLTGNSMAYYLNFANTTSKISYASSFGRSDVSETEIAYIKQYLKDFRTLSAREESAKQIIESLTEHHVELVVDPVFLLSKEKWSSISEPIRAEKYVFVYAMENTPWLVETIDQVRTQFCLPIKIVLGGSFQLNIDGEVDNCCGPRDFLSYIKNAEYIITNSFHGSAFSIVFEKKFICVAHSSKNTRLKNLMKIIDSENKQINDMHKYDADCIIDGASSGMTNLRRLICSSEEYLRAECWSVEKG